MGTKTILVTGGAGYIGSHTVLQLLQEGFSVVVVDNLDNSSEVAVKRVEELSGDAGKNLVFHKADLRDREALNKIFASTKFDAVIHFAGLKAVGESVQKPLSYYDNNLIGTITLLEVMAAHGCKSLVFSSSATVYGWPKQVPCTEEFPLSAANPYGRTKLIIEDICRDIQKASSDWKIMLLRYFNPIGAHPSGHIGEDPRGIPNNLMPYIQQIAVGRRPSLTVFGSDYNTNDGTGPEAPALKRVVAGGKISVVTANTTALLNEPVVFGRHNVEASSYGGMLIRRQRRKRNVELQAQQQLLVHPSTLLVDKPEVNVPTRYRFKDLKWVKRNSPTGEPKKSFWDQQPWAPPAQKKREPETLSARVYRVLMAVKDRVLMKKKFQQPPTTGARREKLPPVMVERKERRPTLHIEHRGMTPEPQVQGSIAERSQRKGKDVWRPKPRREEEKERKINLGVTSDTASHRSTPINKSHQK
ncbi:hypothetical protein M5K25_025675 [Dendrobium thyrsiflorum]|uniref:UDP-glucose 4-epimerase n=1 Tax=Dendrobium thyrsiflorum TaxID=117978 RepID=A0ABD0U9Y3_DENTH